MLKIGLTGGIGSGKSTVAKVFEELGIAVFYADSEAKKFLFNSDVKIELSRLFGEEILDSNGEIIKVNLAQIVFSNPKSIQKLNELIHPLLMEQFNIWALEKESEDNSYVIMEAAILFEAGFNTNVDRVLCITASIQERIARVMKRDGVTAKQVEDRMSHQWSDEKRAKLSDFVIDNSGSNMILEEIIGLHSELSL